MPNHSTETSPLLEPPSSASFECHVDSDKDIEYLFELKEHSRWHRFKNWQCAFLTVIACVSVFAAIGLPLIYYVIVPAYIQNALAHGVPLEINHIGLDHIFTRNLTAQLQLDAKIDRRGIQATFSRTTLDLSLKIDRLSSNDLFYLASMDLESFNQNPYAPIIFDITTPIHSFQVASIRFLLLELVKKLQMENAKFANSSVTSINSPFAPTLFDNVQSMSLQVNGYASISSYGLKFSNIRVAPSIPLELSMSCNLLTRF